MEPDPHSVREGRYAHLVLPVSLAVAAITVNAVQFGGAGLSEGLRNGASDLLLLGPRIAAAVVLAAVIQVWLPREKLGEWFGRKGGGVKGLLLASFLGAFTVGGPFASFPLVAAMAASGVELGALVAFLTGWSLLGIQRVIVWEWPLLGTEFVMLRFASCIAMPVLAGIIMRRLA